ncbi:MAG TPA: hypothetical protein VM871_03420, partial [Flavisolibacter sp.]|nr:hypothetical protein [Flavisolibacter sp.]
MTTKNFEERLKAHAGEFARVVPYEVTDKLLLMDFTERNKELTDEILLDTNLFIQYINEKLKDAGARYEIGGWNEHRTIYRRSTIFGPSPTTIPLRRDGAEAPSRWEGDEHPATLAEEDTIGYRYADPSLYGLLREYALKNRSVPTVA